MTYLPIDDITQLPTTAVLYYPPLDAFINRMGAYSEYRNIITGEALQLPYIDHVYIVPSLEFLQLRESKPELFI